MPCDSQDNFAAIIYIFLLTWLEINGCFIIWNEETTRFLASTSECSAMQVTKSFRRRRHKCKRKSGSLGNKKTTILAPVAARSQQPDRPSVSTLTSWVPKRWSKILFRRPKRRCSFNYRIPIGYKLVSALWLGPTSWEIKHRVDWSWGDSSCFGWFASHRCRRKFQ